MNRQAVTDTFEMGAVKTSVERGLLQRKCACGTHTVAGGSCETCADEKGTLRRAAVDGGQVNGVPPIVGDVLRSPGRPLDADARAFFEPRFAHDFSHVRVHTDAHAAESARAVNSLAYTVGSDVVFGAGSYAPDTAAGRGLLAHELTHVVQQQSSGTARALQPRLVVGPAHDAAEVEADRTAETIAAGGTARVTHDPAGAAVLRRRNIFSAIAGLFRGDDFSDDELKAYLAKLDKTGKMEGYNESDNKARAVVKSWSAGKSVMKLTPRLKALLIKEMIDGATLDDDERAILTLLEKSDEADIKALFAGGLVNARELLSNFHGDEDARLRGFFDLRFEGGTEGVLAGAFRLVPRAQKFGGETVLVADPDEAAEVSRIIKEIKDTYGIDLNSEKGVEAIKKDYPHVPATELAKLKTREWSLEELRAVKRALSYYAPILGAARAASTRAGAAQEVETVSKVAQAIDKDTPSGRLDTSTYGEFFESSKNFSIFKALEGKSFLETTIVHELAHGLLKYRLPSFVTTFKYWKDERTPDADPDTKIANKDVEAPISGYGAESAGEDLSETAKYFFVKPKMLKEGLSRDFTRGMPGNPCPERFKFMEETVAGWKAAAAAGAAAPGKAKGVK